MIVKELFDMVKFETLWECMLKLKMAEPIQRRAYFHAYTQISTLDPVVDKNTQVTHVIAFKHLDDVSESELEFEEGPIDISGINPNDLELTTYALEFTDWKNWLAYEVFERSLKAYGPVLFLSGILFEMTFFGYDYNESSTTIESETKILNERMAQVEEDIKTGEDKNYSTLEDLRILLDLPDTRTEKEKEHDYNVMFQKNLINCIIVSAILGVNKVPPNIHSGTIDNDVLEKMFELTSENKSYAEIKAYCESVNVRPLLKYKD